MNGDKNARARALSKIFEEMLARSGGDKDKAKKDMDDKLGDAWQVEIVIEDDIGSEFIPEDVKLDKKDASSDEIDEMLKKARKFSKDFVGPGDDLEMHSQHFHTDSEKDDDDSEQTKAPCLSDMLRELADALESEGI